MPSPRRRLTAVAATSALVAGLLTATAVAASPTAATAPPIAAIAAPSAADPSVVSEAVVGGLAVENSFVSAVGWVKPGESYPSRIIVTNTSALPVLGATVTIAAPVGSTILMAGTTAVNGPSFEWRLPRVDPGATQTLVLESAAASTTELPTIVWRDLSTSATVTLGTASKAVTSHGPKVIPPGEAYETARYGDRPFPVVPVAYADRDYQAQNSGDRLEAVINDPAVEGSTFNLFQEMSLGQLYPNGTVPSAGIAAKDFAYEPGFDFHALQDSDPTTISTCTGLTFADSPIPAAGTQLYPNRIENGVYQLPGMTQYYGADGNGSAVVGSLTGVAAFAQIDSGCGPTAKLVWDAAAIADPEIDYSDYDTDKDGVVDFFMAVYAGCGGHGASQLTLPGDPLEACPYLSAPYDNVWPHSSSLEYYFTDETTGLPGFTTDDQLKDLEGRPLFYETAERTSMTTTPTDWKVFVRVGPYNVNPENAIEKASVISHEYGHSLGLPDFYSTGGRSTYGDWNLMATDKSQNMDSFSRQELGWVVPEVLDSSRTVSGMGDSKQDTDAITWQRPDGTPYTLSEGQDGVGRVQNSEMYVAKLPGRILLDPDRFASGEGASASHTWWSGAGNDFGCATDGKGHNIDLSVPELSSLPEGTTVDLAFKSMFDIEWDYDYGYVLTSTDGGKTFASHPSTRETLSTTTSANPNQNGCQASYGNGITGSSTSYTDPLTLNADRALGEYKQAEWITDTFDVSDLAGADVPVLRFSYATDPGLARPGWFIDDVKVTATLPDGSSRDLFVTDFETSGGPDDARVFNGGCQPDNPGGACTKGWHYVNAGSEAPNDHAYYVEMRDRSGFDLDGHGQIDRDPIGFAGGLYAAYTDEAHGYGNAGVDDPPAQTPIDSQPEPGAAEPDLNDAAFTAADGDTSFSDFGEGHTDNYEDPAQTEVDNRYPDVANPWRFRFDCLAFDVLGMSGNQDGPATSDGDLTGDVKFTIGDGCGEFDHGYVDTPAPQNTAPTAAASASPVGGPPGTRITFDATGSTDAETPDDLDYVWDFGNGGPAKDATGAVARHAFGRAGTYDATVTVTDPSGLTDTATVRVTITEPDATPGPDTGLTPTPTTSPTTGTTTAAEPPSADAPLLTVGSQAPASVDRTYRCQGRQVGRSADWRVVAGRAPGGSYCENTGSERRRDVLRMAFSGDVLDVVLGRAVRGGMAVIFIDGERIDTLSFRGRRTTPRLTRHAVITGLGDGSHRLRLVVRRGRAFIEGFGTAG